MLKKKKLSNEEKENLQKSAELLSQVVIKNDSNPLGVKIIKDSCYQQLLFAHKTDPEFSDCILKPKTEFYIKQVRLILIKFQLTLKERDSFSVNGIKLSDARSLIANAILNLHKELNLPYAKGDPRISLIPDLLNKTISQGIGIIRMLNLGLYSEAFCSWRTFHESICIIKLLIQGGEKTRQAYLKHIVYSNAFRGGVENDDERNHIFDVMKKEMKENDLKSKDMKKYIEYGWLYSLNTFDKTNPDYKLNFRDGIQRCADLRYYSEWYEAASELSHSSAIFFYSQSQYFTDLTIHGFYDMLNVLDEIINSYYSKNIATFSENSKNNFNLIEEEFHSMVKLLTKYFNDTYFEGEDPNVND